MVGQGLRRAGVALACAVLAGLFAAVPPMRAIERQGIDLLLPLGAALGLEARPLPERPPVALVAIREETYRDPDFADRPRVAWTPQMAAIMAGIAEGGATVLGLDMVYSTTLDRPELLPGFDRAFTEVLIAIAGADRLVLGYVQSAELPILPLPAQVMAVGGADNLRPVNVLMDGDDVVRRYPGAFPGEAGPVRSFAAELVLRAGGAFDARAVPLIDPTIAAADVPIYEIADLWRCARAGDLDFFRRAFAGRVVILGTILDVEDRRLTARRLMGEVADHAPEARCTPGGEPVTAVGRPTTPGAIIHAAAAMTQLLDRAPRVLGAAATGAVAGGVVLVGAGLSFLLAPVAGALALALLVAAAALVGAAAIMAGLLLPVPQIALATAVTFAAIYAYRFVVEDRTRRRVTAAFRHYLAPSLVDRLAETADGLRLGGELREVTVLFVDLAGFTALAERLADDPQRLVALTNAHLAVAAAEIERRGGYVDKFIGDAVMGVWGAPLPDPLAARHAVEAAIAIRAALAALRAGDPGGAGVAGARIGVNSGPAVIGNVGAPTRLNYTVLGDAVNLAARLETANKAYGSTILIGEATRRALVHAGDAPAGLRRIDRIRVEGRSRPVRLYEVVPEGCDPADLTTFHAAMIHALRGRRDPARAERARSLFSALAPRDPVARAWRDRMSVGQV